VSEEIRIRVALAMVQEGKILLVPHYDTDAGPVQWVIPGGRLRFGESARQAARREFEEETGLLAEVGEVLDVSEVILPERPYHSLTVTFGGRVVGGALRPEPDHPFGQKMPHWFAWDDLALLAYHPQETVRKALNNQST
jgi:8-oxo-dGTP diphosphatase